MIWPRVTTRVKNARLIVEMGFLAHAECFALSYALTSHSMGALDELVGHLSKSERGREEVTKRLTAHFGNYNDETGAVPVRRGSAPHAGATASHRRCQIGFPRSL